MVIREDLKDEEGQFPPSLPAGGFGWSSLGLYVVGNPALHTGCMALPHPSDLHCCLIPSCLCLPWPPRLLSPGSLLLCPAQFWGASFDSLSHASQLGPSRVAEDHTQTQLSDNGDMVQGSLGCLSPHRPLNMLGAEMVLGSLMLPSLYLLT